MNDLLGNVKPDAGRRLSLGVAPLGGDVEMGHRRTGSDTSSMLDGGTVNPLGPGPLDALEPSSDRTMDEFYSQVSSESVSYLKSGPENNH